MKNSDPFIQDIKNALDDDQLDNDTLQRLAQARHLALHQQQQNRLSFSGWKKPALAFASIAMITILISLTMAPQKEPGNMDILESMDIISSSDEFEMYENLEFYLWLDEQSQS